MDLNANVLAMAIAGVPRHKKNGKRFLNRSSSHAISITSGACLRRLVNRDTFVAKERRTTMYLTLYPPEAPGILPAVGELRESGAISSRTWLTSAECYAPKLEHRTPSLERIHEIRA